MKHFIVAALMCFSIAAFAEGENCTTPKVVTLCPGASFTGESTAGMGNDKTNWKQTFIGATTVLSGNDKIYEVNLPAGAVQLWIDVNSTSALRIIYTAANCNPTYYANIYSSVGTCQQTKISVTGQSKVYITIDHANASDIAYDIAFSVTTGSTSVDRGNIYSSTSCGTMFKSWEGLGLKYNGTQMTMPLYYSPLNVSGVVCYQLYLENTSGKESIKSIQFNFGPHLSNVSPVSASVPGFYATGNWVASQSGSIITYTFNSASGRGDYDDVNSMCRRYEFYMNMTPLSNDPWGTTTTYSWTGDGYGNFISYTGCFSTMCGPCSAANCVTGFSSGVSSGNGSTFDPPLPLNLLAFQASRKKSDVHISWTAPEEIASFGLQKSLDGISFETIQSYAQKHPSQSFSYVDEQAGVNTLYYRLQQTSVNQEVQYSEVLRVSSVSGLVVFPNPTTSGATVDGLQEGDRVLLFNSSGQEIFHKEVVLAGQYHIDLRGVQAGIYIVKVISQDHAHVQTLRVE